MTAIVPGSRLARFVEAADSLRNANASDPFGRTGVQRRAYDDARARLLDSTTDETGPATAVSAEQAEAIVDKADGAAWERCPTCNGSGAIRFAGNVDDAPPPTRPSVAPGDPARAREADARAKTAIERIADEADAEQVRVAAAAHDRLRTSIPGVRIVGEIRQAPAHATQKDDHMTLDDIEARFSEIQDKFYAQSDVNDELRQQLSDLETAMRNLVSRTEADLERRIGNVENDVHRLGRGGR